MFRLILLCVMALAGVAIVGGLGPAIQSGLPALPAVQRPGKLIKPPTKPVSRWGAKFNPSGKIYENGFRAFYFDRTAASVVPAEEYASTITVKYAWSDLRGIDSPTFAGYWVGRHNVEKAGAQQVAVSLSWAKARIFIDGLLVYDDGRKTEFMHYFSAGDHLIEVEFINNWHTTEFKVTFQDPITRRSSGELGTLLRSEKNASADVYYVGLYESDRRDSTVDVLLPDTGRPAIVWLDSYEAIDWRLHAPNGVSAAVIASYTPGSQVVGAGAVEVLYAAKGYGVRSAGSRGGDCHCTAGRYHCEQESELASVAKDLKQLTGRTLAGASASYKAAVVRTARWDDSAVRDASNYREARETARRECAARADPDFDRMLD